MTANITWSDFWCLFIALPDERKVSTWNTNFGSMDDWKQFIKSKTDEVQIEILKHAPRELIMQVADCLMAKTKKKLLPNVNKVMVIKTDAPNKVSTWSKFHPA
jgi:hypothetical protein